jgi:hypothetical protein
LATDEERESLDIPAPGESNRPGIRLIRAAGRRWEIAKYDDLIYACGEERVVFDRDPAVNEELDAREFRKVLNLFEALALEEPPQAVIEAEFRVPDDLTPALPRIYRDYELEDVRVRPDILWVRPARTGAPLIQPVADTVELELHVVDVKLAAEPSLRHFVEVTFYALALDRALRNLGLDRRYAVSAEGLIWPGSYDANEFRNRFNAAVARNSQSPATDALEQTLKKVPYEIYQVHVRQFFEEYLPRVLATSAEAATWHVSPTCQLCEFLDYCAQLAAATDHLSRIAWLTQGQAEQLRVRGIQTTAQLAAAIADSTPAWQEATQASHQLRSEGPVIRARAESLQSGDIRVAEGRRIAMMPRYWDMGIYLTVHFDLGTGITFGMSVSRVFFRPGQEAGTPPVRAYQDFIVDRVEEMNPDSERMRLIEFIDLVAAWLREADEFNERVRVDRQQRRERDSQFGKVRVHFFAWDQLEFRQLRRMLERHMAHPDVIERVELLVRLFPPEGELPDPEAFRSQPGTAVKEVFRHLVGVPIPHDYTLIEVANAFYPRTVAATGEPYQYRVSYGFVSELSDQIPFERAYELWQDRPVLRHPDGRRYTRGEVYSGLQRALQTRIDALEHVVNRLREQHGDRLVLRKGPFSAAPAPVARMRLPVAARMLNALEQLDVASRDIETRALRALPVEEREARFHSIRGLRVAPEASYAAAVAEVRRARDRYTTATLRVFTFSPFSRDTRIREGDFNLALSNETDPRGTGEPLDLEVRWRDYVGLTHEEALDVARENDCRAWVASAPLRELLGMELARLEAAEDPPFVILKARREELFALAIAVELVSLNEPLVLDPIHQDYESEQVEQVLRTVGGTPNAPLGGADQ